ncbi:MAG: VanZ family protein [Anaerolineales bacterium]|nr:VanZ family protein [Anaerolineales bacterium]MDP2975639.1 VanZ family protein [Anaerolineales bacterium]
MLEITVYLRRWLPAILIMATIFVFSSIPSSELPDFARADLFIKKGGHMLGYGLLTLAYLRGLCAERSDPKVSIVAAWLLAVLYASGDEFHQSFVAGRHASPEDVGIDAIGAAIALLIWIRVGKSKA